MLVKIEVITHNLRKSWHMDHTSSPRRFNIGPRFCAFRLVAVMSDILSLFGKVAIKQSLLRLQLKSAENLGQSLTESLIFDVGDFCDARSGFVDQTFSEVLDLAVSYILGAMTRLIRITLFYICKGHIFIVNLRLSQIAKAGITV